MTSEPKSRKREHAEDTRAALVRAAQELFAKQGYEATLTEDIVRKARVTRGALYHHFAGKDELFRVVFETVEARFIERLVERAATAGDPWEQFCDGCLAFLDLSLDPSVRRILLIDGPAVLGWATWRQIDSQFGFGLLRDALSGFMDSGVVERQPPDALAHLLIGAINEAALATATAEDPRAVRHDIEVTLRRLLDGLRPRSLPKR